MRNTNSSRPNTDYDNMSRAELANLVNGYVDPHTTRDQLIVMALLRAEDNDTE